MPSRLTINLVEPFHFAALAMLSLLCWDNLVYADTPTGEPETVGSATIATADLNQLADNVPAKNTLIKVPESADSAVATSEPEFSRAEQITRLEKAIQIDEQRLSDLRAEIVDPMSEYRLAEVAYKLVDEQLAVVAADLEAVKQSDPASIASMQQAHDELAAKRKLAGERFNLAIETRKTLQEQIAAVEAKQAKERQALDKLTGNTPLIDSAMEPMVTSEPAASNAAESPAPIPSPAPAEATAPPVVASGLLMPTSEKAPSKELVQAESVAQAKKDEARLAEQEAQTVSDRIAALDKDIELENKLLIATRKKSDIAYQTSQTIESEKEKQRKAGTPDAELRDLREQRRIAEQQFQAARAEVEERVDRLNALQTQRAELQREELEALNAAQAKQHEADEAESVVAHLKNPFSVKNLLEWALDHGVKVAVILLGMLVLRWMLSLTTQRIVHLMIMRGARGTKEEREDRAKTLVGVFYNAVSVTIVIGGVLMVCEEVGIAVAPLMGGAAVLGLAFAFGAQNLIRDYFYGFVILLENQYKLNDVLKIGDIAGQVEQITLRMTVLRDLEGNVHFIPNGKIDSVTNMTHGWSRAVIEVGIDYSEDTDRIMGVLMEVAAEMREDPQFSTAIIGEAEMLGVDSLDDSAVKLKFLMKTRPASKWPVKREMLRRIKRRFDELGISIPFPQQVVHHRYSDDGAPNLERPDQDGRLRKKAA